jgi:hypothetical protein
MSCPAAAVPARLAVMKMAKMKPWGSASPPGLSAGVHRNTKVYMEPSNNACMAPSSAMRSSGVMVCVCVGGGGQGRREGARERLRIGMGAAGFA